MDRTSELIAEANRKLRAQQKAMGRVSDPCSCESYPFPHRPGGGKCSRDPKESETPAYCGSCGRDYMEFKYIRGYKGARDGRYGPPLEPDEPPEFECPCGTTFPAVGDCDELLPFGADLSEIECW